MAYGKILADQLENSNAQIVDLTAVVTDNATESTAGYMSAADKAKLEGIDENATAGATAEDVGLENCDNTSDANKPVSTATQTALNAKADLVDGKVPSSQLPSVALTTFLGTVASEVAMLDLDGEAGDWAIRSDLSTTWIISGSDPSVITDWTELASPASDVTSVNGSNGAVTLGASDVGAIPVGGGTFTGNVLTEGSFTLTTAENGNGSLTFADDGSEFKIASNSSSGDMIFQTNSTDRITIKANGDTEILGKVVVGSDGVSSPTPYFRYQESDGITVNNPTGTETVFQTYDGASADFTSKILANGTAQFGNGTGSPKITLSNSGSADFDGAVTAFGVTSTNTILGNRTTGTNTCFEAQLNGSTNAYISAEGTLKAVNLTDGTTTKTVTEILEGGGGGGGGGSEENPTDTQEFTTSGTWTKPAGITKVKVTVYAGGGGGGGGAVSGTGMVAGVDIFFASGGGGAGSFGQDIFDADQWGATESVTVGAGGTGGAASSTATGNAGTNGGFSAFGTYKIYGGQGGQGGLRQLYATSASYDSSASSAAPAFDDFGSHRQHQNVETSLSFSSRPGSSIDNNTTSALEGGLQDEFSSFGGYARPGRGGSGGGWFSRGGVILDGYVPGGSQNPEYFAANINGEDAQPAGSYCTGCTDFDQIMNNSGTTVAFLCTQYCIKDQVDGIDPYDTGSGGSAILNANGTANPGRNASVNSGGGGGGGGSVVEGTGTGGAGGNGGAGRVIIECW